MKRVQACLKERVGFKIVIVSNEGSAAVGIGANKTCCDRAAYLALATTSALKTENLANMDTLMMQARNAELLTARSDESTLESNKPSLGLHTQHFL